MSLDNTQEVKLGVETMRRAILAVLYHEVKLADDAERHSYCPDSEESWCQFKRTKSMEDKPHHLDPIFLDLFMPTFVRLSDPVLLERCLNGYTQNQNESLNALIWKRCPKFLWRGPTEIQVGTKLAVLQWNSGSHIGRQAILDQMSLPYEEHTQAASIEKDARRVRDSLYRASEQQKGIRTVLTKKKAVEEERMKKDEGKTYGRALFSGLVEPDKWDSEDDEPLADNVPLARTTTDQWDSDDNILVANVDDKGWQSEDDEPLISPASSV